MTLSFSLPTFFIIFRETTEAAIIVSVLLSFLSQVLTEPKDQALRQRLSRQVWNYKKIMRERERQGER
jgi:high-affinity iron transporter